MDFSSGYVLRSIGDFPKAGSHGPWRARMNYLVDIAALRFGALDDGTLEFGTAEPVSAVRS